MNLGFRIKHLRIEKELTQEELANTIGMKKPTVSLYESNNRRNADENSGRFRGYD